MNTIIGKFGTSSKFKDLVNKIEEKNGPIAISGLTGVGSLQLLSGINEFTKKPILILTYNEIQAKRMLEDIKYFSDKVTFFPKKEVLFCIKNIFFAHPLYISNRFGGIFHGCL